ncbi:30S ribosomal protein S17-like [Hydractinia symbiolongicarpus]|uniref:30S ribosomal protein S17-like n=1 Tax=Hydractinia symbiolongicarpus TaxID=13093 RepID=UPI002550A49B|nr:30S ribosomal protein S17-like [Hydractinia symbiolongicarpus]
MAQFLGQVIGTKMNKTVKVCVTSLRLHPEILKYWNHKKVYFAHDENNDCREGDYVLIKEGRKLTKKKWFTVIDIVEKAPRISDRTTQEVSSCRNSSCGGTT